MVNIKKNLKNSDSGLMPLYPLAFVLTYKTQLESQFLELVSYFHELSVSLQNLTVCLLTL